MKPPIEPHRESLPRVLGLFDAVAIVVGSIIGSGIFLKASVVARELHAFGPIVAIWAGLGLITLCGALALAELAAMLPQAGGPYVYLREAYGRLPAFLWGWTEFWVVRTGSLGALACATVIYLNRILPMPHGVQAAVGVGLILFLTAVNWRSTRWGASVQSVTAVIKVGFVAAVIVVPFMLGRTNTSNLAPVWSDESPLAFWRSIGVAAVAVLWAYDGWINVAPLAEDIRNPQRNIPLALALGMVLIVSVYVAANTAYHLVLPMDEVIDSPAVASEVFYVLFGGVGATVAAVGVMFSTFGATQSNLLTGPRIYFAMARDGLFPKRLAAVHDVHKTPANAVAAQGIWASVLVIGAYAWQDQPSNAFDALTDFVIFGGSLFYALAVAAVFVLRWKLPDAPRPYRTWGYPFTPAIYLLAFAAALVSMLIDKWEQTAAGSGLIAAGVIYYAWRVRRGKATIDPTSL
ncbi:MAG: amino acid permease [Planctomycetes bacterium]|nr:amino acid permease [Planctomycetota bacterium]